MLNDELLGRIIESLSREATFTTINMKVTIVQSSTKDAKSATLVESRWEESYSATNKKQRIFDQQMFGQGGFSFHRTGYSNGSKCASVWYDRADPNRQSQITISHNFLNEAKYGFLEAPIPYRCSHVGLIPLHEAIPAAEHVGTGEVIGRSCNLFHFRNVGQAAKPQALIYYLDAATSAPLKVEAYDGPQHWHERLPNWIWEARSLDRVGDRHFPFTSAYTTFLKVNGPEGKLESVASVFQSIKVSKIDFDSPLAKDAFWPTAQPGVEVLNEITHRSTHTAGGEPIAATSHQTTESPIRVADSGSNALGSVAFGIALSILILFVAGVLWRRAR